MTDEPDSRFRIYQHDSRELKSRLEAEFEDVNGLVDTIITSPPPYADLIDYGDHDEQVGQQNYESSVPHKASSASCFCGLSSVSKRLY